MTAREVVLAYIRWAARDAERRARVEGLPTPQAMGGETMPNLKDVVLSFVLNSGLDPEDVADFVEGLADAVRKGLKPTQAALYALLETQSEELSEDDRMQEVFCTEGDAEGTQQLLREIFRAVAKKF